MKTNNHVNNEKSDRDSITVIDRSAAILNALYTSEEPKGISELSSQLSLPKATVFRIVNALHNNGLITKNEEDKYQLGLLWIKYGTKAKSKISITTVCTPYLKKLAAKTDETVNLGIFDNNTVVNILSFSGESSLLISRLLPVSPLYCSAMGKQYLARMSEKEIKKYYSGDLKKNTMNTIVDLKQFLSEKDSILENVISYDNEEYEYGLCCIAAPLLNSNDQLIATINISGPLSRLNMKGKPELERELLYTASEINKKIADAEL